MKKKTDKELKHDVETELRWDPKVNAAQIGVTVDEGAVSLFGTVDTYAQRWAAQEATKRVAGVPTIAHDLTVKLVTTPWWTDSELAVAVKDALKWNVFTPTEVTANVKDGAVTLQGEVKWHYQREAAEHAVRCSVRLSRRCNGRRNMTRIRFTSPRRVGR